MIEKQPNPAGGRYNTSEETKRIVWIQAAGHCELCGTNLTRDFRVGTPMRWGEVAHILPASPKGPRARSEHDEGRAQALTNDCDNLMLLCPGCHDQIDRDAEGYPESDLSPLHAAFLARIRLAATTPDGGRAIPLIVQSQHFATVNDIPVRDLLTAMSAEGLTAFDHGIKIVFAAPGPRGRDKAYWQSVKDDIQYRLQQQLRVRGGVYGDAPVLAVVGLADIPALMMLGQSIGDRFNRQLYSVHREHRLRWPNEDANPPEFHFTLPTEGDGSIALVLSISAYIPMRDVNEALPGARVARLDIAEPSYGMVQNRRVIHAFRDALQSGLSQLEALTEDPIHVFAAIPAALAIEFGAVLTTEHQHSYQIFDRDNKAGNKFQPVMYLGPMSLEA
jgi:hypothetical protein